MATRGGQCVEPRAPEQPTPAVARPAHLWGSATALPHRRATEGSLPRGPRRGRMAVLTLSRTWIAVTEAFSAPLCFTYRFPPVKGNHLRDQEVLIFCFYDWKGRKELTKPGLPSVSCRKEGLLGVKSAWSLSKDAPWGGCGLWPSASLATSSVALPGVVRPPSPARAAARLGERRRLVPSSGGTAPPPRHHDPNGPLRCLRSTGWTSWPATPTGTRRWPTPGRRPARSASTSCCSTAVRTSASCSWPPPTCPGRTIIATTAAGGCPPSSEDRRAPAASRPRPEVTTRESRRVPTPPGGRPPTRPHPRAITKA